MLVDNTLRSMSKEPGELQGVKIQLWMEAKCPLESDLQPAT